MKTIKSYAIMTVVALCATAITSCSPDEDITPEETQSNGEVIVYNQVKYFQNNIVEIDSLGNFERRVNGAPLNSVDTTELYIGVADLAAAVEMFQDWLSPDTEVNLSVPSNVDMEAGLKDENGQLQETVYFKAVNEAPTLAEVTFAKGTVMKHVSKIIFIKESAWPENDESPWLVGDFETYDTFKEGKHWWLCIREAKTGVSGMMMYISYNAWLGTRLFAEGDDWASPGLAKEASKILRGNWDSYVSFFKEADRTLDSSFYWIDDYTYAVWVYNQYAIKLSSGEIDWFDCLYHNPRKHFIQLRTFGL